ncbi:hypothetical protein D3C81_1588220 [compost metagenome]
MYIHRDEPDGPSGATRIEENQASVEASAAQVKSVPDYGWLHVTWQRTSRLPVGHLSCQCSAFQQYADRDVLHLLGPGICNYHFTGPPLDQAVRLP